MTGSSVAAGDSAATAREAGAVRSDRIGRLLQVRASERRHAGYFFLFFLLIGAGLAIGRGTSDALFFKRFGVDYLPLVYMAHAGVLFVATLSYSAVADRLAAEKVFRGLLAGLAALLLVSWMLVTLSDSTFVYPFYYLVYEVASDLLVLHIGVYMAQNFETQQAKRLTPLVFAGAQLGSICGGLVLVLAAGSVGVANALLVWIGLAGAGLLLMATHHRRYGVSPHFRAGRKGQAGARHLLVQIGQGLSFARRSALMRWSSLALFLTVITFYVASYAVSRIYTDAFATEDALTAFFGWLTMATGVAALLLQLLATGRLLNRIGVGRVNLIFPATTVASFALLLASFTVPAALFASINKDAIMKAFRNPVRSLLFGALPANMQGRARAVAAGMVLPLALVLTGGFLSLHAGRGPMTLFLVAGLAAALAYFVCNLQANRAYARGLLQVLRERLFVGVARVDDVLPIGAEALEVVRRGVAHEHDDVACTAARVMIARYPEEAPSAILARLPRASIDNRDRLVNLLRPFDSPELRTRLRELLAGGDDHLRGTIYEWLVAVGDEAVRAEVPGLLESRNPRLAALGVFGVYRYSLMPLAARASERLAQLLRAQEPATLVAGLAQLARVPDERFDADLERLRAHDEARVRRAALEALAVCPTVRLPDLVAALAIRLRDPDVAVRRAAVYTLHLLPEPDRLALCQVALEDRDGGVRKQAVAGCVGEGRHATETLVAWLTAGIRSPRSCTSLLDHLVALRPPRARLREVADSLARQARDCAQIRARLLHERSITGSDPVAPRLLGMALAERAQQLVDLTLAAIGAADDPDGTRLIRAGLRSHDRRHIASAREALRHIPDRELAGRLDAVLDSLDLELEPDLSGDLDVVEGLRRLAASADPWLRECAERTLGSLRPRAA